MKARNKRTVIALMCGDAWTMETVLAFFKLMKGTTASQRAAFFAMAKFHAARRHHELKRGVWAKYQHLSDAGDFAGVDKLLAEQGFLAASARCA